MGFKPHQLVSAERKKSSAPLGSPVRRKLHSREPKRCLPRVRSLNPGSSRIKLLPIQRPFSSINFLGSGLVISYTSGDSRQFRTFKRELKLLAILHPSVSCCSFTICQNVIMPKLVGASFTSWVKENEVQGIFSRLFF